VEITNLHFDPSVSVEQVPALVHGAIAIGTWKAWKARFQSIDDQIRDNPLMEGHLRQWYEMECAMNRALKYEKQTGKLPHIRRADLATHRLLGFVASLARVHGRLSPAGAKQLESRVRGALTDKNQSLASIAFELQVVTHLMHRNVDVICNDLESRHRAGSGGTFDFLACHSDLEVEIECKAFSGDIGRKIHRRRFYELSDRVQEALLKATASRGSFLAEVTLPGGLLDASDIRAVMARVVSAIETGISVQQEDPCSVTLHSMTLENSPFDPRGGLFIMPTEREINQFIRTRFGFDNINVCAIGHPRSGFAFLVVRSRKPDTVADYILENLKDGSKQLSGTRPGIVCAHMIDMTGEEIVRLSEPSTTPGMQTEFERIMRRFFGDPRRNHVYAARFSAPGQVEEEEEILGDFRTNSYRESGKVFRLKNASHPLFADKRMEAFD
jgi:hypothetical protein